MSKSRNNGESIVREHLSFKGRILQLAWLDMIRQYRGATLSWAWAIIRPLTFLAVYFFVMKFGLKASISKGGIDLFPWLAVGLVAWFYISDILNNGTNSFKRYKFLITKMKFPVSVIPTITTLSNMFIHMGLLAIVIAYLAIFEDTFSMTWLQLPIYTVILIIFSAAWSLFASPLSAISGDFHQLIKSIKRIMFWLSGVIWNVREIDIEWVRNLMLMNPITGFIEGYRDSLLYHTWFWEEPERFIGLVLVTLLMMALAAIVFKRTRKEVVDVL